SVTWIPSPNFDLRPPGTRIDTLIIHDTESPGISKAATIAKFFADPRSGVAAHYIIGKAGEIVQCVHEADAADHAGLSIFRGREHVNNFSIGIELVNAQTGTDPFTDAQYASLSRLVAYLVAKYAIPLDRIVGHHDVSLHPQLKRDPASNFDWERFLVGVTTDLSTMRQAVASTH
ncbi:MAG: N-acetylmuramoyl-L-alanine amidase, partial [Cyanobacteria bacterium REEB65]|nr:N-acetylmuramoyl-L-alanine amidase [Cyanobacteria bacterium REEB65]